MNIKALSHNLGTVNLTVAATRPAVIVLALLIFALCAHGYGALFDPPLQNASFEEYPLASGSYRNTVETWHNYGWTWEEHELASDFPLTPYGDQWCGIGDGGVVYQQFGTWDTQQEYEISLLLGHRGDREWGQLEISLWVGGNPSNAADAVTLTTVGASQVDSVMINPFASQPASYTGTAPATVTVNSGAGFGPGDPLWIQFAVIGGAQNFIDNVEIKSSIGVINRYPGNNAVHVDPSDDLTWQTEYVSGEKFNVYFGTDPGSWDVELLNYTETSYNPQLDYATEYSWRVDMVTGGQTYPGQLWSFTTGGKASDPVPVDAAAGVNIGVVDLAWTGDSFATHYKVYTGTSLPLTEIGQVNLPAYDNLHVTDELTTYYWRIDTYIDDQKITEGDTWSLTTRAKPSPCIPADLNGDCRVNFDDLLILTDNWLDDTALIADLTADDKVNLADLAVIAENWQKTGQLSVIISEFAAVNRGWGALLDEDNDSPDWIEIHNITDATISLKGWHLTDRSDDLNRWEFPGIIMTPDSYLLVFASGKNRRDPEGELHTNFSLDAGGGYLALVRPDGSTIAWAYDDYPQQYGGVSFGVSDSAGSAANETIFIPEDTPAKALIPTDDSLGLSWTETIFDDEAWSSGQTAVGYDTNTTYDPYINLDVFAMRNNVESVYIRIPFGVDDVAAIDVLTLRMKYDDAFVAYINGTFVARSDNSPEIAQLAWNSGATGNRDDGDAVVYEDFGITLHKGALVQGQNVLAIHGLNWQLTSSDLLMLPQLKALDTESIDLESLIRGYFLSPTPDRINNTPVASPGPWIDQITDNPPRPSDNEDLTITARIEQTIAPVDTVTLHYRVMYGGTVNREMFDDGLHNDGDAADGIYAATIPANAADPGEMVRWYVTATDDQARASRNPLFPYSTNSAEYFGSVIADPSTSSLLPVIEWFTNNVSGSEGGGARASVYYDGRFYDNILIHNRGGSTTSASTTSGVNKVHLKFNFNTGQKFQYDPDNPSVNEFNLNHTYSDKAYLRQSLAFEYYDRCGCPGSESFLMRTHRNGQFHAVRAFIEEPEEEMLEREGLDPRGALYKMYNQFTSPTGEKKTRRWEGSSDLSDFMNGMNQTGAARHNYIFDAVDMPRMISYLVGTIITHQNDHPHKNHYLYRDSEGSGEWFFMPWDHDLTWGSNWTGSSYHDYIYADDDQVGRGTSVKPSHPFVGKEDCQEWNYHWNRLTDKLLNDMTFREMYLRRLRTVMDDILKAPGTPYSGLVIEKRIDEIIAQARPDIEEDFLKWVYPAWNWGGQGGYPRAQSFDDAINILKSDYLGVRRTHLFVTHNIDNAGAYPISGSYSARIPNAQPDPITIQIGQIDYNPISYNQDHEYIELHNPNVIAVDISGWKLTEAVEHTFLPGTVIPAGQSMYVSPDAATFRTRIANPTGGQGHFVQGNYRGHLSSWGETIVLLDRSDRQVDSLTYQGSPSDAQRYLRISEIMYHPPEDSYNDAGQYEYIELKNIGPVPVETAGMEFTKGITYSFGSSSDPDITELVSITDAWKYEDSGIDLGTEWRQPDYTEGPTWSQGAALFFVEQAAMPEPKNTPVTPGLITYYFRTHFLLEADPDVDNINLWVRTIIDDGAIIYINGDEAMRLGMPDGDVSYSTLTDRSINDAQYEGPFVIPTTSLVQGDNVIAVEVHQVAANNIDVVFGLTLSATVNTVGDSITMNPGKYVLLAKNPALLSSRYENIPAGTRILGPYLGQLSNAGETVKLEDMTNSTIIEFDYNDNWFDITDGYGFSLTIRDVDNPDLDSWDSKSGWWPSAEIGGSPGEDDPDTTLDPDSIVISEVMTHTDDLVSGDWIEIWNRTASPIYIGGWFLSDNTDDLMKYEIAANDPRATITPDSYVVFDFVNDFGNPGAPGSHVQFGLSEHGEDVYLTSGAGGVLTGEYSTEQKNFGAAENGVTLGMYIKSDASDDFVRLQTVTKGSANNNDPIIGPVVIGELMYNPQDPDSEAEFIEVTNLTSSTVFLYDTAYPANTWQIKGVSYVFPPGITLSANETILITRGDPTTFRATYGIPGSIDIYGPYPGALDNGGEKVTLIKPGAPDPITSEVPEIRIDRVNYSDGSHPPGSDPWPTTPDGGGQSLRRKVLANYGNDLANWEAANPSPGQ